MPNARLRSRRRRRSLTVDPLEARIAPAIAGNLFVSGTTLVYSGTDLDNNLSISSALGTLTLTESAGTIRSTVPGFSSGAGTTTGTIPSYITSVAINGGNGNDTVTIPAGGLTLVNRALAITAESIVVSGQVGTNGGAIGENLTLNGQVAISSPTGPLTLSSAGSAIAGNITIDGDLYASTPIPGTGLLTIDGSGTSAAPGNVTISGTMNLSSAGNSLEIDGNTLTLGTIVENSAGTGSVTLEAQNAVALSGDLVAGSSGVVIDANRDGIGSQGFTTSGNITTNQGQVTIQTQGAGNIVVPYIDTQSTTNGIVTLAAGGAIVDGNGAGPNVRAQVLDATAGTTISLDSSVALINELATTGASGVISLSNANAGALTVTAASTVDGSITLSNNAPIVAGTVNGNNVVAGGAGSTLTITTSGATSDVTLNDAEAPAGNLVVNSSRDLLTPSLTSPLSTALVMNLTAVRNIEGATSGQPLAINTTDLTAAAGGVLDIGNDALASAPNPHLILGSATSGDDLTVTTPEGYTIVGNVTSSGGSVSLASGVGVAPTEGALLSITSGVISAADAVNITADGLLTVASGTSIQGGSGGVEIKLEAPFVDGSISLSGLVTTPGNITIDGGSAANSNLISLAGTISAGGDVAVDAGVNATLDVPGTLSASGTVQLTDDGGDSVFIITPSLVTTYDITGASGNELVVLVLPSGTYALAGGTVTFSGGPDYQPIVTTNVALITRSTN